MGFDRLANNDFERAMLKGFWRRILSWFTGEQKDLLPFDAVREQIPLQGQRYIGLREVLISQIVGSSGRYLDFDRDFIPLQNRTKDRWISIDKAHYQQVTLQPIELYKIGEAYFVKDGNHRVSVARERGQEFIDAYVIEIDVLVAITPQTGLDDLALKRAEALFLETTTLHRSRPESNFDAGDPQTFDLLLEHISAHQWYLGERTETQIEMAEAAASWYDQVYLPLIEAARAQGIFKQFQRAHEAELYLWITKYQWLLRQAYLGDQTEVAQTDQGQTRHLKDQVARQMRQQEETRLAGQLANTLRRAAWVEEMIFKQERASFLEKTHLNVTRPDAGIETNLPGQYARLLEHIAVHCWYLGEQRQAEVSLEEAAASWYDHVYQPLVQLVCEQEILRAFPQHTETDLYLWIISRQAHLRELFGGEVSFEQAAEAFLNDMAESR